MHEKQLAAALCAALGCVFAMPAMAAAVQAPAPLPARATPLPARAAPVPPAPLSVVASRLGLDADAGFVAGRPHATVRGTFKSRERQTWRGVPVYGRSVVVERDARGTVLSVNGSAARGLGARLPSALPRLAADQALAALHRRLGDDALAARQAESTLFVRADDAGAARLVYRVSYVTDGMGHPSRPTALVDANTGEVLRQWDGLTTGRRPPVTPTLVPTPTRGPGGNELTGQFYYDGSGAGRELLDAVRVGSTCYLQNDNVATYDLAGGQRVTQWSFGCAGSNPAGWVSVGDATNGAYSPINDAHHFGGVVHDMYTAWFGSPPLKNGDGSPMQLAMWVHYGTNYEDAFWDGAEMVFGDGDQFFYPFVALDVTGHEISHGFTEQHSGLEYVGQSGAMNEAFSDMAGEAAKYFDRGTNDFMVGADLVKPATVPLLGMPALRDMCTPSNDGFSIDNASQYNDNLDVHYASGVYNRAFCTLARTAGWNTRKAFEVFHDANALYWGPEETFDGGACGAEQAATDRGYAVEDVAAAFAVVGVACAAAP